MMTPREGSTLYYSLLWTPAAARQRFINRLFLIQTLGSTLDEVQEPQVAEHKIHWWHEELQRLREGQARHPATQAAQSSLKNNQTANDHCLSILSATSTCRFTPPTTDANADQLLAQNYRARLALLAHALSDDNSELDLQHHSTGLACALGRHEQLIRLPQLLHRGQAVFSNETYQRFNTRPTDLASHIRIGKQQATESLLNEPDPSQPVSTLESIAVVVDNTARQVMLNALIEKTHQEIITAIDDPATQRFYRRKATMPLWRLTILREKQLALWQRRPPDLLRERSTLTPLRKLFWAWRHRR